jgi:hypothetical protein
MSLHPSDSALQVRAEGVILEQVGEQLGATLAHRKIKLPEGATVDVDGVSDDPPTLVEAYARQGVLRGGQLHKIAGDVLKLVTVRERVLPGARLVIAFASPEASGSIRGWLAEAMQTWGVQVVVAELPDALRAELLDVQHRQRMVNPPPVEPVDPDETLG